MFNHETTIAILAGFAHDRRVMVQGYHGTGKSTHIEQIAARLNWPCVRVNLDSHISRIDLIGKDAIKLREGKQITEFKEGILPWSIQNPVAISQSSGAIGGAIIGNAVASRLGDHNGFQYVVDIDDSDEDISIVQSGDEQIPIGSKVTISIGTNTRIIISE